MNRILWNRRPDADWRRGDMGCIDEIVLHGVTVHVEQMDDRWWWIGISRDDGTYWHGNFTATSRGVMRFTEQENNGITWERDDSHEEPR